jgi:hypothetical protein
LLEARHAGCSHEALVSPHQRVIMPIVDVRFSSRHDFEGHAGR